MIIERELDGTVRHWPRGCESFYGWGAAEACGRKLHLLLRTVFPAGEDFLSVSRELVRDGQWRGTLCQTARDGSPRLVEAHLALHQPPGGQPPVVIEYLGDAGHSRRAEFARSASEARLHSVFETAADAILVADGQGRIVSANRATLAMFGYKRAEELVGANLAVLMPQGEGARHDGYLARYSASLARGGQAESHAIGVPGRELMARRRDGSEFPIELSVGSFDSHGEKFFTGIVRDITERRQAEEMRHLLLREVDHRAKNALAVALSLLRLTPRQDAETYASSVEGRVAAMARAHSLLAQQQWEGAELQALIEGEILAYRDRVALMGPQIWLTANAVQPAAMVIHELVVNAAKHGAFSTPEGRVALGWSLAPEGELLLCWKEHGLAIDRPPRHAGFGSRLLQSLVHRQLQGQLSLSWEADGLCCRVTLPARLAAGGPGPAPLPARSLPGSAWVAGMATR
ncbi:PAS domain S-box protein [Pseudoroseomonas cervicalis]|uniref:PAS domain S-box protein n=1 Tax=Teichococcus cervicalis TaxID=204525 RepID=UPI0027804671|nr:PAS domain S-box protein [Pseudoroseomonas cervicalis]MDQ1078604.1 PAS domain S-box-containing protein [Pseudoroseomonas cervicalis]